MHGHAPGAVQGAGQSSPLKGERHACCFLSSCALQSGWSPKQAIITKNEGMEAVGHMMLSSNINFPLKCLEWSARAATTNTTACVVYTVEVYFLTILEAGSPR